MDVDRTAMGGDEDIGKNRIGQKILEVEPLLHSCRASVSPTVPHGPGRYCASMRNIRSGAICRS